MTNIEMQSLIYKHIYEKEYSKKDKETAREILKREKQRKGHIHCPVNGWDCPYFDANGCCMMYPDSDPLKECDDFAVFWDEGDDYICYEEH